ncbi:MAG: thioredoxin family protein, partial [Spirochaetia bacterium]|nr:thioredoxin family protein [Spirochaetia bacterium]
MKIQILGSGCPKCKLLEQHAREAVADLGIEAEIVKVSDTDEIMEMGVMMTPALAIDDVVKSAGKVLTKDQVKAYLDGGKIHALKLRTLQPRKPCDNCSVLSLLSAEETSSPESGMSSKDLTPNNNHLIVSGVFL